MPHIYIQGEISLDRIWKDLKPFKEIHPSPISLDALYLHQDATNLLFRMTVVEENRGQRFHFLASLKPDGIILRIDPYSDPIKTDVVKRAMAIIADRIRELEPESSYGPSNIAEFLISEAS